MFKAILACNVFYSEINKLIEDKSNYILKLMPQGLHSIADSSKMKAKLQEAINELESEYEPDYIILIYGLCGGGIEGLKTTKTPLVIPKVHDCISLLLGDLSLHKTVNNKGTYYLSRGWIDCGGDTYKQYLALTNKVNYWQKKFKTYQKTNSDVILEWPEKKQYIKFKKLSYDKKIAEFISFECIKGYQKISLINNNNLKSIHYEYTKAMHIFSNDILRKNRGEGIKYSQINGQLDLLKKLIFFEDYSSNIKQDFLLFLPPETPLELQKELLN